jgi:hypothetical protein
MILFPPVGLYLNDTPFIYFIKLFIGLDWTKRVLGIFQVKLIFCSQQSDTLAKHAQCELVIISVYFLDLQKSPLTFLLVGWISNG